MANATEWINATVDKSTGTIDVRSIFHGAHADTFPAEGDLITATPGSNLAAANWTGIFTVPTAVAVSKLRYVDKATSRVTVLYRGYRIMPA